MSLCRVSLAAALVAVLMSCRAGGSGEAQPDLARTRGFVESWARRDMSEKFPESPSFAYYNAYATLALGGSITPALRQRIVDAMKACQQPDGGFAALAKGAGPSNVVFTAWALRTLELLGAVDAVDRPRAVAYLKSLVTPAGGMLGRPEERGPSLGATYHGVLALAALHALESLPRDATVAFVRGYHEAGQGFGLLPAMPSTVVGTAMGVKVLTVLGALDGATAEAARVYLERSRYAGHLPAQPTFTTPPSVEELAWALDGLADMSALGAVDRTAVGHFVDGLYIAENGGFGPEPGLGSTPPATFYAVYALVKLGRLRDPLGLPRVL